MSTAHRGRFFSILVLFLLLAVGRAQAELVPYLDVIGWEELQEDGRFSHLTLTGGLGQGMAVFDTGIDPEHVMFAPVDGRLRVLGGANFIDGPLSPIATPDTPFADGHDHGTLVSSVAGGNFWLSDPLLFQIILDGQIFAPGTQLELSGVAPGSDLLALRVLGNDGFGSSEGILAGLQWAIENAETYDIRVLNLSLGIHRQYDDPSEWLEEPLGQDIYDAIDELKDLGIVVIAASGNDFDDEHLSFPAVLDNVISVGASQRNPADLSEEELADFGNRNDRLDLVAPGVDAYGALPRWFDGDATDWFGAMSGTSFAAPIASGAVVLINEVYEDWWGRRATYDEIVDALTDSDTFITDPETGHSFPRLNLTMAMEHAATRGGTDIRDMRVWVGDGGTGNWSDTDNWSDGTLPGDEIMFAGVDTPDTTNTLAPGTSFESIIFARSSGAFTLSGNAVAIDDDGSIRNQSLETQTIALDIDAAGDLSLIANGGLLNIEGDVQLPGAGTLTSSGAYVTHVSGAITGGGDVLHAGPGILTLSGANTYTGGTEIQEGVLLTLNDALPDSGVVNLSGGEGAALGIGDDETIGSLAGDEGSLIDLGSNTLTLAGNASTTFAGTISGTLGTLEKQGSGTLRLTGSSTHTGATRVLEGTLVAADQDDNLSDEGRVSVASGATFTLDGADETVGSLGNINGDAGTIQLNDNQLTIAGAADSLFAGVIDGTGGVAFDGSTFVLHDLREATLNYSGTTRVDGGHARFTNLPGNLENHGRVTAGGTLAGDVVNHGRFGGTATVNGRFTNEAGGVVAPGQSIGTLTINGSFEAKSGSTYEAEVEGADREGGNHRDTNADLLKVNATNDDPGTIVFSSGSAIRIVQLLGGKVIRNDNVFLIADAENGITLEDDVEFLSPSLFIHFDPHPSFSNGDDQLRITASAGTMFRRLASEASHNTRQIAYGLDTLSMHEEQDALVQSLVTVLDGLPDGQANEAFQLLAPSIGPQAYDASRPVIRNNTSMMTAALANHHTAKRLGVPGMSVSEDNAPYYGSASLRAADDPWMLRRTLEARERRSARQSARWNDEPASLEDESDQRWNVFAYTFGSTEDQETTGDRLGYTADSLGFVAGFDYAVLTDLDLGFSLGYMRSEVDLDADFGTQNIGSLRVGPQLSYSPMPWFIDASATYGFHQFDTERRVPTLDMDTESNHDGHDLSLFARGGYQWRINRLHITPTASLEYLHLYEEGHTETGPAALVIDSRTTNSLRSRLGVTADYRFDVDSIQLIPEVSAGWEHEFLADDGTTDARFVSGGEGFTTRMGELESDALFFSAGLGVLFDDHMAGFLRYHGRRHGEGDTHALTGGISIRF